MKRTIIVLGAIALALALAGGALAGKRYLITSSSQVKNGSLSLKDLSNGTRKALKGRRGPAGQQGPKGDTGDQGLKGDKGDKGDTGVNSPLVFGPYQAAGPDSGFCGNNWANDSYTVTFVVAPQTDGSFVVSEVMKGSFTTLAGASPNNNQSGCLTGSGLQINAGITGSLYGDFVVPVAAPADFNSTATLDDSTPCGATCTSDRFFAAFFGESAGYTNSTSFAWQFFYTTPGNSHGHWADTDHTTAGDSSNGDIHN
jgi:hypothetical protein